MLECPICLKETNKLIIPAEGKMGCRSCVGGYIKLRRCDLGQTVEVYPNKDGKEGRLTTGKAWEIENRSISRDDGKTVINSKTGKPAQY